jgi:NADPH-dependent 2,4-dienoyl-CoA reductase/sulfur reductase-like enzyme
VLVVGGGPAGTEAARVAAMRGHHVVLCEASDSLGGNMRWSRQFPTRAGIGDSIDWLAAAIGRLGVDVRLGTRVDDATIAAIAPDVVVVATGGQAPGRELTSTDVVWMGGPPAGAKTALVVDRLGGYEVLGVSELLTGWGIDVQVVTPLPALAQKVIAEQVITPARERIAALPGRWTVQTEWDESSPRPDADLVVVIDRVAAPIAVAGERETIVVGDAAEPGNLWAAIRTGNAAGRSI